MIPVPDSVRGAGSRQRIRSIEYVCSYRQQFSLDRSLFIPSRHDS
jgi:hypothetical protein